MVWYDYPVKADLPAIRFTVALASCHGNRISPDGGTGTSARPFRQRCTIQTFSLCFPIRLRQDEQNCADGRSRCLFCTRVRTSSENKLLPVASVLNGTSAKAAQRDWSYCRGRSLPAFSGYLPKPQANKPIRGYTIVRDPLEGRIDRWRTS